MNYTDNELRAFSTEEIYHHLQENFNSFILQEQVILCDELLLRHLPIKHIEARFEFLVRKMKSPDLMNIDAFDFKYSKATVFVAVDEIIKRGKKPLEWLYMSKFEGQKGPVDRLQIDQLIEQKELDEDSYLWRIGMEDWKPLIDLPYLEGERFYDQEFNQVLSPTSSINDESHTINHPIQEAIYSNRNGSTSFSVIPGVMELLSFPMWFILIFMFFFTGFTSKLGLVLPFIFSILVLLSVIPVGIGLIARKKWAWSIKIATGLMTVVLILFKLFFDQAGGMWDFILVYQLIILGLLFYGRKTYEISPV